MEPRRLPRLMVGEKQPKVLRVTIVEDDTDIRAHLARLIAGAKGFSLVSDHRDAIEAIPVILREQPDVVLMDLNLPGMSGIECARILKQKLPAIQILVLTIYEDSEMIFESLKAGASGYLLKRTPGAKLLEAIRETDQGGSPMSSLIARKVVEYFSQNQERRPETAKLTERERAVLDLLSRGQLYKEIADSLTMSLDTVRKHLQSIYRKLRVHTRTEAVVKYLGP